MFPRRMWRWFRRLAYVGAALIGVVAVAVVALRLTNPSPTDSDGWDTGADMPDPRGEVASASVGARFVVMGGLRGVGDTSRAVSVYEIERDAWKQGADLPEPRHHAAAAALDGTVYLTGGAASARDWTPKATVWSSSPGGAWERLPRMPEPRHSHAMVAVDGRLVVVGGVGPTDDTLIFDPDDGWTRGTPIPEGRDHLAAVAREGEVWALAGRAGGTLARVDIYDPETDEWRDGPPLPTPMSAMAVGVIGGRIHVVGGEDPRAVGGGVLEEHYVLSVDASGWREGSRPVLPVHGGAAATHGDRLLIAGGASRQGAFSTVSWTGVTQIFAP